MDAITAGKDVLIQTDNLEAAVRFYQSILGLLPVHHTPTLVSFETVAFGSAPASGAVFRALAENFVPTEWFFECARSVRTPCVGPRGRVQPRPGRTCSPTSEFGLKRRRIPKEDSE